MAETQNEKPVVELPVGRPPVQLEIKDLTVGDGPTAGKGDTVHVHYVGVALGTGREFDSSWERGEPIDFTLGGRQVIRGWDMGIKGMKVGGRRRLVIPSFLGYGSKGAGPDIAPGETLVFVCDLVGIDSGD
jgi:peptidylprolyl isomerase